MEELGRTLTPSPLLGSILSAAAAPRAAVDGCGTAAAASVVATCWAGRRRAVDPAAAAVAFDGSTPDAAHALRPRRRLRGPVAGRRRRRDDIGVFDVDPSQPGVARARRRPWTRPAGWPRSASTARTARASAATRASARTRRCRRACVALSAEQVGAAERILELTVEYTKMRRQFGRPIGSFQALKHRMADLHVLVESARSASYAAADGVLDAAWPRRYCSEAFVAVAAEAIQLHGGIAITWEHDAHLYFKRAHGSSHLFGSPREHIAHARTPGRF